MGMGEPLLNYDNVKQTCHYLLDQDVRMIGIDALGLDRAPRDMAADHKKGIPNSLWPTHMVLTQ